MINFMKFLAFKIMLALVVVSTSAQASTWKGGSGIDWWNDNSNWMGGSAPDAPNAVANFGLDADVNPIIALAAVEVGTINFASNASNYNIGQFVGVLQMSVTSGNAAINVSGGNQLFSTGVSLLDNTVAVVSSGTSLTFSGPISGTGNLTKLGAGSMIMSGAGANTSTGTFTQSTGTTTLQKTANTAAIVGNINLSGGTLLLGASEQIANTSDIAMSGGTLGLAGNITETLDSLTLTANSTIDLNGGNGILQFSDFSFTGSSNLFITNWDGDVNGGGSDQVYFGNGYTLSAPELAQVKFNIGGDIYDAKQLSTGEVVAMVVPESGTSIMAVLLFGVMCLRNRGKRAPLV